MKSLDVLYTCNLSIQKERFKIQAMLIPDTIRLMRTLLKECNITGLFFLDIAMLLKIQEKNETLYQNVYEAIVSLVTHGHNIGLLINLDWEEADTVHEVDHERLLDIFAQGKYYLKAIRKKADLEYTAVRIQNAKIQPFIYLKEIYSTYGIKIDASVFPKIKAPPYVDFYSINIGEIIKFSNDPTQRERFGEYLAIPRGYFTLGPLQKIAMNRKRKKDIHTAASLKIMLDEEYTANNIFEKPILNTKNKYHFSPDTVPPQYFAKIVDTHRHTCKDICVLESSLYTISQYTQSNLRSIKENFSLNTVPLSNIVAKYLTTYKIRLE